MKRRHCLLSLLLLGTLVLPVGAQAWDQFYDGSVMPDDPLLGDNRWNLYNYSGNDLSQSSTDGDKIHIADVRSDATAFFSRFAVPSQSPVTFEARVRVFVGDGTALIAGTPSFYTIVWLYGDRIDVGFAPAAANTYQADLSQFRTIRIATDSQGRSYVWLDEVLLAHGTTTIGNQGDLQFGSTSRPATNQSCWDYVAYSDSFEPIPEPSSLLALGGGIGAVGASILRRRRR